MKRRAIFFGVDDYAHISPLSGAVADATAMRDFFKDRAGYDTELFANPRYPDQVTERVRKAREGLGPGDLLLVYFAGHGVVSQELTPRLLCADAHPDSIARDAGAIKFVEWQKATRGPQDTVIVMDACQEDLVQEGIDAREALAAKEDEIEKLKRQLEALTSQGVRPRGLFGGLFRKRDLSFVGTAEGPQGEKPAWEPARGAEGLFAVLHSCQIGKLSYEFEGHGLFTGAFLRELNDAANHHYGVVVNEGLRDRVNRRMTKAARELEAQLWREHGQRVAIDQLAGIVPALGPILILPGSLPGESARKAAGPEREEVPALREGEPFPVPLPGGISLPMLWCPATTRGGWRNAHGGHDTFSMGARSDEDGANCFVPCDRRTAETRHDVRLTHGFWIGETEVTQGQWKALMGTTVVDLCNAALRDETEYEYADTAFPDEPLYATFRERKNKRGDKTAADLCYNRADDAPVYFASWNDAKEFCARLTEQERKAGRLPAGYVWRLPTEAEWEYACRAGRDSVLPNGVAFHIYPAMEGTFVYSMDAPALDGIAWYGGNSSVGYDGPGANARAWERNGRRMQYSGDRAAQRSVFAKKANDWGIRDMLGNVWEWCEDWCDRLPQGRTVAENPVQTERPQENPCRIVRGGSWYSDAQECRPATRWRFAPGFRNWTIGFRVVLGPEIPGDGEETGR